MTIHPLPYHVPVLETLTKQLAASQHLTGAQIAAAVLSLTDESVPAGLKADFLTALSLKGETVEEIACFVGELRSRALRPQIDHDLRAGEILDVVGTGGDRLSTFNISTTVALLSSAAGITVAKHGNRASTSPIGSADVMEALGIPFDLGPEAISAFLAKHRFAFFFAPRFHPAFRNIVPARKLCAERGQPTLFNFLGPLLNPAQPSAMLVGVPRPDLCEPLAKVLQMTGVRRAMVVCGAVPEAGGGTRWLDEFSPLGPTRVAEFYQDKGLNCSDFDPGMFPIQPMKLADLRGGDREVNAAIIQRVLSGEERGPKRDAVLINAAAALFVAGRTRTLLDGWDLAAKLLDDGSAARKFESLRRG